MMAYLPGDNTKVKCDVCHSGCENLILYLYTPAA